MDRNPTHRRAFSPLWIWASLAWAAFVVAFFLARAPLSGIPLLAAHPGHLPPWPDAMRRFAALLRPAIAGAWALYLTLAAGKRLLGAAGIAPRDAWVARAWRLLFGVLALQAVWLGLGFNNLMRTPVLAAAAAAATLYLVLMDGRRMSRGAGRGRRTSPPLAAHEAALASVAGATLIVGLAVSLLPETFYDSMAYVLSVPKQWLLSGGIPDHPWHLYDHFTLAASLWFMNGLFGGGETAARLLSAALPLFCAFLAGGWAGEEAGGALRERAARYAFALTLCFPLMALNSWACRSDVLLCLAAAASLYAMRRLGRPADGDAGAKGWLFASGSALGLAFGAKYAAAAALPAWAALAWAARRRVSPRGALAFALGFLAAAGPWFLRNLVDTGDPVYPYLPGLFHGLALPDKGLARLLHENRLSPADWLSWPPAPWRLLQPGYGVSHTAGPVVLALLPGLFLFPRVFKGRPALFGALLALFAPFLALSSALRFALAAFLILFLLFASAVAGAGRWEKAFGWAAAVGCAAGFLLPLSILGARFSPLRYWTLREDAAQYRARMLWNDPSPLAEAVGRAVEPGDRLLLVGDGRALAYGVPTLWSSVDDEPLLARCARESASVQDMTRRLRRYGVTHLGFHFAEGRDTAPDYRHWEMPPGDRERMVRWCETNLVPVEAGRDWALYVIRPGAPGGVPAPEWEKAFPLPAGAGRE